MLVSLFREEGGDVLDFRRPAPMFFMNCFNTFMMSCLVAVPVYLYPRKEIVSARKSCANLFLENLVPANKTCALAKKEPASSHVEIRDK